MNGNADAWASIAPWAGVSLIVAAMTVWIGGRFLTIHLHTLRASMAYLIGNLLGYVFLGIFVVRDVWHWYYGVIFLLFTMLSVLLTLTGLELLLGHARPLRPFLIWRTVTERLRDAHRYFQISRIIAQHGLAGVVGGDYQGLGRNAALGRATATAMEQAGTTFVKLGQVLAARTDILPAPFRQELERLHNNVLPISTDEVRSVVREELGNAGIELANSIHDRPLASASIAQVHGATLPDGTEVVVKVQRPNIQAQVERDLIILGHFARRLERSSTEAHAAGLVAFVDAFGANLRSELDFTVEAANQTAIATTMAPDRSVRTVRIYPEHSTERILVMEYVDGVSLNDASPNIDPHERRDLARALLGEMLRQILDEGVFHADPHPGNVFLEPANSLVLLDFGSIGRLDQQSRHALLTVLIAVDRQDPALLTDGLLALSLNPNEVDRSSLETNLRFYLQRHLGDGQALDVSAVQGLFEGTAAHSLSLIPDLGAVMRAIAVLDGTLQRLDPDFKLLSEAKRVLSERSIFSAKGVRDQFVADATNLLPVLRRLPRHADQLARSLNSGRLSIGTRIFENPDDRQFLQDQIHLFLMTMLVVVSGLMGAAFLAIPNGPILLPGVELYDVLGFGVLLAGSVMLLRVLISFARSR